MPSPLRIALVEISTSHEECLYSQIRFLNFGGHRVVLFINEKLQSQVSEYAKEVAEVHYLDVPEGKGRFHFSLRLAKKLKNFDRVILNTASSSKIIRNLSLLTLGKSPGFIGVLHDVKRLKSSFTQKLISWKIKKYFLLNDGLLLHPIIKSNPLKYSVFYPIFFPQYPALEIPKTSQEIWIGIPGRTADHRRDYDLLFEALEKFPILPTTKIFFLGKLNPENPLGKWLKSAIENSSSRQSLVHFDRFIPNDEFHAYLRKMDFILPLLQKDLRYNKDKISGSINLAFAYGIPLLCHGEHQNFPDFQSTALFYTNGNLGPLLQNLKIPSGMYSSNFTEKLDFKSQAKTYLHFL